MRIKSDLSKLNKFVKTIDEKWAVRVGIFSDRTDRKEGGDMDNAAVGLSHELGVFSRNLPIRSWLRMPLMTSQAEIIRDASHGMKELLALGRIYDVLKRLGFACEDAILAAFKSGGFGTWAALKPATIRRKMGAVLRKHPGTLPEEVSTAILIDTGQLRRSVASQVVKL